MKSKLIVVWQNCSKGEGAHVRVQNLRSLSLGRDVVVTSSLAAHDNHEVMTLRRSSKKSMLAEVVMQMKTTELERNLEVRT